jgi:hypothetical protein
MVRGIDTSAAVLPFRKSDANFPDAGRLITALRQIGYSLEQALADLVDNSINAGARSVLIRFLHDGNEIKAVAVVDDGAGMDKEGLQDAMRFGSKETASVGNLGKFGMGLKLASLSHAQALSVYSRSAGETVGRRWTLDGIRQGWMCERVRSPMVRDMLDRKWGPVDVTQSGTLVLWENLDKLPSHRRGLKYTLTSIESRLKLHLGMCFHAFIERGALRVVIDQLLASRVGQGLYSEVKPLNPFGYQQGGAPGYPKRMTATLSGIGPLELEAHIWPANCDADEYKLGRRSATRQGFYFYRNKRLIQAGGWNGLLHDETEPHSSLARVRIDLPVTYDSDFGINVQKSTVLVPPVFPEILRASSSDGTTFEDFRRQAIQTYRSSKSRLSESARYPEIGFGAPVLEKLKDLYGKSSTERGFRVQWVKLSENEYFRLDPHHKRILLNSTCRSETGDDAVKVLLAVLLRNDLNGPLTKARRRELDTLNELLIATANRN